jgi:hypothetical protein
LPPAPPAPPNHAAPPPPPTTVTLSVVTPKGTVNVPLDVNTCPRDPPKAPETHVVPVETNTFPTVPGATMLPFNGPVPLPKTTLF